MMHWGDYGWGMGFGWARMILFWVLVILGAAYLVKLLQGEPEEENATRLLSIFLRRDTPGER